VDVTRHERIVPELARGVLVRWLHTTAPTMAQPIEVDPEATKSIKTRWSEDSAVRSFKPPIDVIAGEDSILLEVMLPGVQRADITVERAERLLVVHGVRMDEHAANGSSYHHVETPRGAFFRAIPVPFELDADPPVELREGILRIRLALPKVAAPKAERPSSSDDNQPQHDDRGEIK
jgi:HSP20 family molecular chaperone IbpA